MRGSFALRAQDDGERQRQIQGSFDSLRSLRMTAGWVMIAKTCAIRDNGWEPERGQWVLRCLRRRSVEGAGGGERRS